MLCCFACQQGHFWSFIPLIPTEGSCILSSRVSMHFCLLAHVCQHTSVLTHSTLNSSTTHMPAKSPFSQSISCARMFLWSCFLIELFLFIICDYLIQTFLFNSMLSPFSWPVSYSWLSLYGWLTAPAHELISLSSTFPLSHLSFIQLEQLFENMLTSFCNRQSHLFI